jgi:purine nucleoside phosphorylase
MPEQVAVIAGSGLADVLERAPKQELPANDYGMPSSPLFELSLGGQSARVLARHGLPHQYPPHRINYRANIEALKHAGIEAVIALNTVGSITTDVPPGGIAVPDQVIDYTWGREHTFVERVGEGADHIDFTQPFSEPLRAELLAAAFGAGVVCGTKGVYAATQGPRLETAAEVDRLERDGADYVGMTGMPEAALAAERGLDYACIAIVVNRAAGRGAQPIHDELEAVSGAARDKAMAVVTRFLERMSGGGT